MIRLRWSMTSQHCWIVPVLKYKNIISKENIYQITNIIISSSNITNIILVKHRFVGLIY